MLTVVIGGILALPALIVQIAMIPVVALLSIPALLFLVYRKPSSSNKPTSTDYNNPDTKRIIITGGSSGIGKCIAMEAAKKNISEIIIIARNLQRLQQAQKEIQAVNPNVTVKALSVDVSNAKAVQDAATEILAGPRDEPPKTTHLICCAGKAYPEYFQKTQASVFADIVQTNQLGSINTAQAFIPLMTQGSVTFCSSMVGQIGVFGYSCYAPTKFALRGYAEVLHIELSQSPIHVQIAYPPDTETPGFEEENKTKPEETKIISEGTPIAQPEQVGATMLQYAMMPNPPFNVYFSFDGFMLANLTAGFQPVSTLVDAVAQVSAMSFL